MEDREEPTKKERPATAAEMASFLGHELRNPLSAISFSAAAALRETRRLGKGKNSTLEQCLRRIGESAESAKDILSRLKGPAAAPSGPKDTAPRERPGSAPPPEPGAPVRILLVDDDPGQLLALEDYLRFEPRFRTSACRNGKGALALLSGPEKYDVVLLDFNLPDSTGAELAGKVKEINRDTVTMIFTGRSSADSAAEAAQAGCDDYLVKPVDPSQLIGCIHKALERQRLLRDNGRLSEALREANRDLECMRALADDLRGLAGTLLNLALRPKG